MKFWGLILIILLTLPSCFNSKKGNLKKEYLYPIIKKNIESISNWSLIEYKEGVIDTNEVNILTTPLILAKLKNKLQKDCLQPSLEFYPIELKEYVNKKLDYYLVLRSTLFPAPPRRYTSNEYYILGF